MFKKILLEIVDEGNCFLESGFVLAPVHQECFRPEHLGHLGEHGGSALCHEIIRETSQERVGRDAGQPVRPPAFQSHFQFACRHVRTYVVSHGGMQIPQYLHSPRDFVFFFLADQQADPLFVIIPQRGHEIFRLVVFASQSDDEHTAGIGMQGHVAQDAARVFVVFSQL